MTEYKNGAEGGTNAAVVTTSNSAVSGDAFGVIAGSPIFDNTRAAHGTMSFKIVPASGAACSMALGSGATPLGGTVLSFRFYVYLTALPTSQFTLAQANDSAGATLIRVNLDTAGKMLFATNSGGTVTTRFTTTNAIPLNQWVRIEVYASITGNTMQASYFVGDSTTAAETSGSLTGLAFGTGLTLRTITVGKYGTDTTATPFWIDDIYVNNAATGMPGPYTETLATPVVVLGAKTNPTTVGGTNGKQVVSWAAVPGAASYDAGISSSPTPDQTDFTVVATGVTSPYEFTGLAKDLDGRAYAIRAKA